MTKQKTILTVSVNPSVDIAYHLDTFQLDTVNRTKKVYKTAGGKGLNVARVLQQLSACTLITGIIGGTLGDFLIQQLDKNQIPHQFFSINAEIRNCIAILHAGKQTEILEAGPTISLKECREFTKHFIELLDRVDMVCISGSLAKGMPADYYVELIENCAKKGIPCLLDCSNEALVQALQAPVKPALIKPNLEELSQLLQISFSENFESEIIQALNQPIFADVEWIVVSLGKDGALAKHKDQFYRVKIPQIPVVNPVGSGDATLAGLAYGLSKEWMDEEILRLGNVCGMLNAQENETGKINVQQLADLKEKIQVIRI